MSEIEITIRSIQHYLYCPHRWGLLEIDKAWAENGFVTKANLLHSRVHNPDRHSMQRGKRIFTSVPAYNDLPEYNLYGITDCLELTEEENGISIAGSSEKYRLCIVEYKPTRPKEQDYHEDDLMQVFAQKICVDYVFGGDCEAEIYYADVKKRVKLPLQKHFSVYDEKLKNTLSEMRAMLKCGKIPEIQEKQKCSGCSMKDLCMPVLKKPKDFRTMVEKIATCEREGKNFL